MTPRAEELHSYMTGLGPVGSPVVLRRKEAAEDLKMFGTLVSQRLRELLDAGVVTRIGTSLFVVNARIGPAKGWEQFRRRPLIAYAGREAA